VVVVEAWHIIVKEQEGEEDRRKKEGLGKEEKGEPHWWSKATCAQNKSKMNENEPKLMLILSPLVVLFDP